MFILIKGDDLLLLVIRPTRHGYKDGGQYKHDFEEEVWDDHKGIPASLKANFAEPGLEMKGVP